MELKFEREGLFWLNAPERSSIEDDRIVIQTEPGTDLWQRTYYGFRNDNAPGLLMRTREPYFSFWLRTDFASKRRFDECGVML